MTDIDIRQKKACNRRIVCTAIPMLFLLASFAYYAWHGANNRILTLAVAAAVLFLYCLAIIRLIPQWQRAWSGIAPVSPHVNESKRSLRASNMHPVLRIVLFALLSRLLIFLTVYLLHGLENGYHGGILDLLTLWTPASTQSKDWLALASAWYSASGEMFHLFPFYPAAVRLLALAIGNPVQPDSFLIAGLVLSTVSFAFSAWLVYELTLFDTDRATAMTAARWFCLLPGSLLLMLPTVDSLFLLLCLCSMVLARRQQYVASGMFGLFAAFTRFSGILLLLPIMIELVSDCCIAKTADKPKSTGFIIGNAAALLLIPLGTALYCTMNAHITGNAFHFLKNSGLQFGFFFDAAASHASALLAAIAEQATASALMHGLQFLHLLVPIVLLIAAMTRIRTSYAAFLLLYIGLTVGSMPSDIPGLIVSAFPLYTVLAIAFHRRFSRAIVTLLFFAGLCCAVYAQAVQLPIF